MAHSHPKLSTGLDPLPMPRAVAGLRGALVAGVLVAATLLLLDAAQPVTRWLVPALAVGAVALLATRTVLVAGERVAWGAALAGVALFAAAYVYWSLDLRHQD